MNYSIFSKANIKSILFSIALISSSASLACINDADTQFFEQQRFPNVEELISGDFIVHTKEFYQWRIKDRLKKLEKDPNNPALLDDLSVSYEKTGQTQKAIETLQYVLHQYPDRYETLANLGTFYIHNHEYEKGLVLLKKAIKINPNAHFGREIYQIKVVEYLLQQNPNKKITFPIQKTEENFADFILKNINPMGNSDSDVNEHTAEILRAINGVGGMLKFGNSDSPILLEVMGDLYNKLDESSDYYTTPNHPTTRFGKIALLFYAAATAKSNSDTNLNHDKFQEYLKIKNLSTTTHFSTIHYSLKSNIETSNEHKIEHSKKELEYITAGGDVENNIYNKLYPEATRQDDLFVAAKKNYTELLQQSKEDYFYNFRGELRTLKNSMNTTAIVFGIFLLVYYVICLPSILVFLYKKYIKKDTTTVKKINIKRILKVSIFIFVSYLIYNTIHIYMVLF